MANRIYRRTANGLESLEEQPFSSEDELQELIATHIELLDGEQITPGNPRRWILIKREKGIPQSPNAADWWSVDHLLVDQDATPTLVEVKRGDNSQVRREVVGQMLDYASHAEYWTINGLRTAFEESNVDPEAALRDLLGHDVEEAADWDAAKNAFWENVGTNLAARRLRLLFVADTIPVTLANVVTFLNEQMPNVEVLTVEVKQYKGPAGQTLVPRVSGHSAVVKPHTSPRTKITHEEFLAQLPNDDTRVAAERLLSVARKHGAQIDAGVRGYSVRVVMPKDVYYAPVTVAWFFPVPDAPMWAGLRNFTFGAAYPSYDDEKLDDLMDSWVEQFRRDDFGFSYTLDKRKADTTRILSHAEVVAHQDTLAERLAAVIDDLGALGT
ncbi:MAG: hypothetical protein OXC99_02155 [Chloroflexi bacterium]|nr:hypothetical protein [Chloroflexota bacterium]